VVLTAAAVRPAPRRRGKEWWIRRVAKPAVFIACLAPLAWLGAAALSGGLGANPIEATNRFLGDWALRFLLIALAVTPVSRWLGLAVVMRFRRMLGLFAFFYVTLHLSSYIGLDLFFHWQALWEDVVKRRYITVGMLAFALLVPLAITSTKGWIKRLGAARWQALHRLVYPAAALGVLHFFMMVKADWREPAVYAVVLAALLAARLPRRARAIRTARHAAPSGATGATR
jgi:methionine sulfoxide reductase heme-binding subunit